MHVLQHVFQHRILPLWFRIIEPPESLTDPDQRYRLRLLNSQLAIMVIIALTILSLRWIAFNNNPAQLQKSTVIGFTAMLVIGSLYLIINVLKKYEIVFPLVYVLGFGIIILNALTSAPPHIEILYVIFLPLVSTIFFTTRGTIIVGIVTIIIATLLAFALRRDKGDLVLDVIAFVSFSQAFIIFATYQRNQLEVFRREFVVEKGRRELLNELMTSLSHDLKTPLTIINTSLFLLDRTTDPEKQKGRIENIRVQAAHLEKIIQSILKLSQYDYDNEMTLVPLNLHYVLDASVTKVSSAMKDKSQVFVSRYAQDPLIVMANADELGSAMTNLLFNAMNYTGQGGTIQLETRLNGNQIYIRLSDSGIGISAEDLPHIFDRFFRADKARSIQTGGTGLGLAITKRVVELHGGEIHVESTPGQGTTFEITLPRPTQKGKPQSTQSPA